MINRLAFFAALALSAAVALFPGCDAEDKDGDNVMGQALALAAVDNVTFLVDGEEVSIHVEGFKAINEHGLKYMCETPSGVCPFFHIKLKKTEPGIYDIKDLEVCYSYLAEGDEIESWWIEGLEDDDDFTLTIDSWPGAGGYAKGTFSGLMCEYGEDEDGDTIQIENGTFNVKILE